MDGEQQPQQQNTTGQLIELLEATLVPDSVKRAEEELQKLTAFPGFARAMLQIMCDTVLPDHLRNAASVSLKNFVRVNLSGEGEAPLADEERDQLRNMLMETMFQMPPYLRPQMTEIVCQISKMDFPYRWPQLFQLLAQQLQAAINFDQLAVSLGTLEQLVHRYRHEMRSNKLWTEILLVVTNDNLAPWMRDFLQLLELKLPELDAKSVDTEPNEHDKLRCEICEIATLFSQRFEDCFMPYTDRFASESAGHDRRTHPFRHDGQCRTHISFLAAICQRPHYAPHFREEGVLKAICDNVVIKNLMCAPRTWSCTRASRLSF